MKKSSFIISILPLLTLVSCTVEGTLATPENNTITYESTDTYTIDKEIEKKTGYTKDLDGVKKYFTENASHFNDTDSDYIFADELTMNGRIFTLDFTYESDKSEDSFFLAANWFLDDEDKLPDAYYFFSIHFNVFDLKEKAIEAFYGYDYEDTKTEEEYTTTETLSYTDISYGTCPFINSVKYSIKDNTIPKSQQKKEEIVAPAAFECVKAALCYAEHILSSAIDVHLW